MRPKHIGLIALALIILFGGFLRLYKLDFGVELPYVAHTDEPTQYNPAIRILTTGDLNPHFFNYPSLPIYLYTAVMGAGYLVGRLFGVFQSMADLQPVQTLQMSVGVVRHAAALAAGAGHVCRAGHAHHRADLRPEQEPEQAQDRPVRRRPWRPLLVALLVALSREHVRLSHYMAVDVMATFFCIACMTACTLAVVASDKPGWLWAAAILGGLSTSCKYNYALLAIPVTLACLLDTGVAVGQAHRAAGAAAGCSLWAPFWRARPTCCWTRRRAWKGIQAELKHYAGGHLGQTGNSFIWYLDYFWMSTPFT